MKNKNLGLRVAGTVFAVIALVHLLRVIFQVDAVFGGKQVPHAASVIAFFVTAALSGWMWRLSNRP